MPIRGTTRASKLGRRVMEELAARGLTQVDLARMCGVDQSTLSRGVRNPRWDPGASLVAKMEEVLGLRPGDLAGELYRHDTASLDAFLATEEARRLALTPEEIAEARHWTWYGPDEEPDTVAWVDYFRARRGLRRKGS